MLLIGSGRWLARTAVFAIVTSACAAPALAGQINLLYNYGNAAGCKSLADGSYDDDSMFYLTRDEFSSYAMGCEFLQALRPKDDSYVITAICGHEGDGALTLEMYRIHKAADGADAYEIFDKDGQLWQRVEPCL